jgi:Zn-finger nucleic acid-binding protein
MLVAAHELTRRCPVDGAALTKEIAHMLVIDRCPTCRGIWLDADEMERINQEVADQAMMAVVRGAIP